MGNNAKTRKKYHPKPCVKPLGMRSVHQMEFPGYQASMAMGRGYFSEQNAYDLLSNADLVRRIAPDGHEILPVAQVMVEAVASIQERGTRLGRFGVSGDEMRILREGIGKTMAYLRTVPNIAIDRAARAAVAEFDRTGVLRV